jgi:hypothetical protein
MFISDVNINFGRGKDKKKRKSRGTVLAGGIGIAAGSGIGYLSKPNKYKLSAINDYRNIRKRGLQEIKKLDSNEYGFNDFPEEKEKYKQRFKQDLNKLEEIKDNFIKKATLNNRVEELDGRRGTIRRLNKFDKLSNKIGKKRALIGAGIGLTAGLGGSYLYNKFKKKDT